jgi:putative ABC transport system permease protein
VVGVAAFLVFIGVAMLSPLVARPVSQFLGWVPARLRGTSGVLARENAMRNPRRTATTASALMIGLALVTLVSIIGASAKQSFSQIIDDSLRADFLVQDGIAEASRRRSSIASGPPAEAEFRQGEPSPRRSENLFGVNTNIEDAIDLKLQPSANLDARPGGVLVSKDTAKDKGWKAATRSRCSSRRPASNARRSRGSTTKIADRKRTFCR